MNNNFDINQYFKKNFGLGNKPTVRKASPNISVKKILLFILIGVACFVIPVDFLTFVGVLAIVAAIGLFIVLPIVKENGRESKEKATLDEWQKNYDVRAKEWHNAYDKFYEDAIAKLNPRQRGMSRLGLDEDNLKDGDAYIAEPFYIHGKDYDSAYRWVQYGNDPKIYRTDGHEITWLYFSKDQVYIYCLKFKLTNLTKLSENTQEFFYSDIVSVSVNTNSVETKAENAINSGKTESIDTEEFRLVVPGDKINFAFTTTPEVNKSVQAMKNLIRQKKVG